MKLPTRLIALFGGGLLLTSSLALAQDERSFQAYYKQAQGYENLKDYQKAIVAYRQAQSNATPEASKGIAVKIERLDELLRMQQFANEGLISEAEKKINKINSLSNRKRFHDELEKLQQRGDATAANYQQLIRQVEQEGNNSEVVVESSSVTPTPQRSTQSHHTSAKSSDPPPKKVTSSMPGITPKSTTDFRTTKSAGSLLDGSGKPRQ